MTIVKSLNPSSIDDILEFNSDDWSAFEVKVGDGKKKLSILDAKLLGIISKWYYQQDIDEYTIFELNEEELQSFRRNRAAMKAALSSPPSHVSFQTPGPKKQKEPPSPATTTTSGGSSSSVYDDFLRSIHWSTKDF